MLLASAEQKAFLEIGTSSDEHCHQRCLAVDRKSALVHISILQFHCLGKALIK